MTRRPRIAAAIRLSALTAASLMIAWSASASSTPTVGLEIHFEPQSHEEPGAASAPAATPAPAARATAGPVPSRRRPAAVRSSGPSSTTAPPQPSPPAVGAPPTGSPAPSVATTLRIGGLTLTLGLGPAGAPRVR